MLKIKTFFVYFLLIILFISCKQGDIEYEFKKQIVKAKTIDLVDGTTNYNIAFTDGDSKSFSFGLYSKYEINDTICWRRKKDFLGKWYVIDCN
jgi:hypothetical protein